jgi:predicted nuclease of restriction endonuclease-like (RecB) superfamily
MPTLLSHSEYLAFLVSLKERVLRARISAGRAVNNELIHLYWDIGQGIVEKQQTAGWGDSVIDQISRDLQKAFPRASGFSPRNLRSIRQFYSAYSDPSFWLQPAAKLQPMDSRAQFLQQLVAEIPWGQHLLILNKIIEPAARLYYLQATAQLGWSRSVLFNQIKAGAFERAVEDRKTHNFALALPEQLADQADEMIKSSYNLEFLGIGRAMKERELEDRLISHLQRFILELGYGFCFIGRQYRLALPKAAG